MLVDGLGDGLMLEGPFDLSFLRTTSFGTLQVQTDTRTNEWTPHLAPLEQSIERAVDGPTWTEDSP